MESDGRRKLFGRKTKMEDKRKICFTILNLSIGGKVIEDVVRKLLSNFEDKESNEYVESRLKTVVIFNFTEFAQFKMFDDEINEVDEKKLAKKLSDKVENYMKWVIMKNIVMNGKNVGTNWKMKFKSVTWKSSDQTNCCLDNIIINEKNERKLDRWRYSKVKEKERKMNGWRAKMGDMLIGWRKIRFKKSCFLGV
jgi:hypothetical protein